MAIRVTNQTLLILGVPEPINHTFGIRETETCEFIAYDDVINDPRIRNMLEDKQIFIENLDAIPVNYGSAWNDPNKLKLGGYVYWVDATGALRQKFGEPAHDLDGVIIGPGGGGGPVVGPTPPPSPSDGDLWFNTATGWYELMAYDSSRSKWLSTAALTIGLGRDNADGNTLLGYGILAASAGTGINIPRDATIIRVFARAAGGNPTKAFDLMVNGSSVGSFSLVASSYKNNTADFDINEDDYVWVDADSPGTGAFDVIVMLWLKWRV